MKTKTAFFLLLAILLTACKSVQPIEENAPSIVLKKPETRMLTTAYAMGSPQITFPAGVYTPDFQTENGIYYLAPTKLVTGHRPYRGGLFIPKLTAKDQTQAAWFDNESAAGGLLGLAESSTTRLFGIDEPIEYEVQAAQAK